MVNTDLRASYTPLVDELFSLAARETTTPEEAAKAKSDVERWVRRYNVATQIMGEEAFNRLLDDRAQILRSQGICPWCGGRPPCPERVEVIPDYVRL